MATKKPAAETEPEASAEKTPEQDPVLSKLGELFDSGKIEVVDDDEKAPEAKPEPEPEPEPEPRPRRSRARDDDDLEDRVKKALDVAHAKRKHDEEHEAMAAKLAEAAAPKGRKGLGALLWGR